MGWEDEEEEYMYEDTCARVSCSMSDFYAAEMEDEEEDCGYEDTTY